jgi:hypothetical protein
MCALHQQLVDTFFSCITTHIAQLCLFFVSTHLRSLYEKQFSQLLTKREQWCTHEEKRAEVGDVASGAAEEMDDQLLVQCAHHVASLIGARDVPK